MHDMTARTRTARSYDTNDKPVPSWFQAKQAKYKPVGETAGETAGENDVKRSSLSGERMCAVESPVNTNAAVA